MKKRLGKLELQIMGIIWDKGKSTVREVWTELYPERQLAYTTIATMMKKLEGKKFLKHTEKERTYIYYPLVERETISQGLLMDLIDGVFDGSAAKLVMALVRGDQLSEKDLDEIQQIILEQKEAGRDKDV
jgi:BlaI family penicillinase repressor